jgi:TolA-binding protein
MMELNKKNYQAAVAAFARAGEDAERTAVQAEALYWLGVARYRSGDKDGMPKTWSRLLDLYPESLWAKKAGFIRKAAAAA